MRCFCCDKERDNKNKGRTIIEPDGKFTFYCKECDFAIWERQSPKFLSEAFEDLDKTKVDDNLLDLSFEDVDRYD